MSLLTVTFIADVAAFASVLREASEIISKLPEDYAEKNQVRHFLPDELDGIALMAEHHKPIDMVLHCPKCGSQHIDEPEPPRYSGSPPVLLNPNAWMNPPHCSHLCHACGCIWRTADVPTNGVLNVNTRGKRDTWPPL